MDGKDQLSHTVIIPFDPV